MRRWALVSAVVSALALAAACSSFDAGATPVVDAGVDAAFPIDDAAPVVDASPSDASDAGEAPDGRFCSQNPGTSCLDFDAPGNPFDPWAIDYSGPTSVTPTVEDGDAGDFVSPPGAMALDIENQGEVHTASRLMMTNLSPSLQSTKLTFQVKLQPVTFDPANVSAQFTLAELLCSSNVSTAFVDGAVINVMSTTGPRDPNTYLIGAARPNNFPFTAGPKTIAANVWTKVELDVAWSAPDNTRFASLYVDDVFANEVAVGDCDTIASDGGANGEFIMNIGLGSLTGQVAKALIDNVVYQATTP